MLPSRVNVAPRSLHYLTPPFCTNNRSVKYDVAHCCTLCAEYFSVSVCSPVYTQTFSKHSSVHTLRRSLSVFTREKKNLVFSRFILKRYCSQYQAVGVVKQVIRAKCVYDSTHINWYL